MKKIRFLLDFLGKKGCFCSGLVVGLLGVLLFPLVSVHAYYTESYIPSGATILLLSYEDDKGYQHKIYAEFPDLDETVQSDVRVAFHPGRNRPISSNYSYMYYDVGIFEREDGTYNYFVSDLKGDSLVSNVKSNAVVYVPIFSDYSDFQGYIAGTVDITKADNYSDILGSNAVYDSSIPTPSKLYINALSPSSVTSVWEYLDNSYEGLQYEVQVENYYAAKSFAYAILSGYTGSSANESIKFNGYINSLNQIICTHTVENYLKNPSGLDEEILISSIVDKESGEMHSINTFINTPVDYSDQFAYSGIPFFQGATNGKHAIYVGSQVTVIPYRIIDGVRYNGNSVVCRRFTNEALNVLVGSTFTEIGSDSNGDSYIVRTEGVDTFGESTSGSIGDSGTFLNFLNQLMSMLTDQTALLGVFNNLLSSVPAFIWVLIGFSIVVGIVAMIVKFA